MISSNSGEQASTGPEYELCGRATVVKDLLAEVSSRREQSIIKKRCTQLTALQLPPIVRHQSEVGEVLY